MNAAGTDRPEKLIHMANQIADFFKAYPHEKAVAGIAEHLHLFWDKRMNRTILAWHAAGGEGIEPLVSEALDRLKAQPGQPAYEEA